MIRDIEIRRKSQNNCFDDIFQAISEWKNKDYHVMYAESWGGKFNVDSKELLSNRGDKEKLLYDYQGIKIERKVLSHEEDYKIFIQEECEKGNVIGVISDAYHLPWMYQHYQKHHEEHIFIIIGADEEQCFTTDSQFARPFAKITYEEIKKGIVSFLKFDFEECKKVFNAEQLIKLAVEKNCENGNNIIEELLEFADYFSIEFDLEGALKNSKGILNSDPIFREVNNLGMGRRQFGEFLKYCAQIENNDYYLIIGKCFEKIGHDWQSVSGLLLKLIYSNEKSKQKIKRLINEKIKTLIEREAEAIVLLKENPLRIKTEHNLNVDKMGIINFELLCELDMVKYYNAKGFATEENYEKVSFSDPDRFYVIEKENCDLKINNAYISKINFELEKDNMICDSQILELANKTNSDGILCIGASEYGRYIEKIKLHYDDGDFLETVISFDSWASQDMVEEMILWKGKIGAKVESKAVVFPFDGKIYGQTVMFDQKRPIKIEFPYNPNMHIFKIFEIKLT